MSRPFPVTLEMTRFELDLQWSDMQSPSESLTCKQRLGPHASAPVGVSFDYPWLIQTVRNLSWPTATGGTVMTICSTAGLSGGAEELRLLGVELFGREDARVPECCQLR